MTPLQHIILWLVLLIVFVVIEGFTMGLTTIWFAGGALIAIIMAVFNLPFVAQIIVFLLVSLALLFFTRPLAVKYFNKDRLRTNVESMIGRQGIVISEIDNLQGIGQVKVGGQEWTARALNEAEKFAVGDVVRVKAVNGVKLMVEADKN